MENGLEVINCASGHPYNMEDGTVVPSSGLILDADRVEELTTDDRLPKGVKRTAIVYKPKDEGWEILSQVPDGIIVIGSFPASQAYGWPVVTLVPNAATASRDYKPHEKLMALDRVG